MSLIKDKRFDLLGYDCQSENYLNFLKTIPPPPSEEGNNGWRTALSDTINSWYLYLWQQWLSEWKVTKQGESQYLQFINNKNNVLIQMSKPTISNNKNLNSIIYQFFIRHLINNCLLYVSRQQQQRMLINTNKYKLIYINDCSIVRSMESL